MIALTLTGCASSGAEKPGLAPLPSDLKLCFSATVAAPPAGELTRQAVFRLIADLKKSELAKTGCGRRLISWYETQAEVYAK